MSTLSGAVGAQVKSTPSGVAGCASTEPKPSPPGADAVSTNSEWTNCLGQMMATRKASEKICQSQSSVDQRSAKSPNTVSAPVVVTVFHSTSTVIPSKRSRSPEEFSKPSNETQGDVFELTTFERWLALKDNDNELYNIKMLTGVFVYNKRYLCARCVGPCSPDHTGDTCKGNWVEPRSMKNYTELSNCSERNACLTLMRSRPGKVPKVDRASVLPEVPTQGEPHKKKKRAGAARLSKDARALNKDTANCFVATSLSRQSVTVTAGHTGINHLVPKIASSAFGSIIIDS
jgi:hypothetical protein